MALLPLVASDSEVCMLRVMASWLRNEKSKRRFRSWLMTRLFFAEVPLLRVLFRLLAAFVCLLLLPLPAFLRRPPKRDENLKSLIL